MFVVGGTLAREDARDRHPPAAKQSPTAGRRVFPTFSVLICCRDVSSERVQARVVGVHNCFFLLSVFRVRVSTQ